jgi:predicted neutral ceramidase superfamily lipid hydrolase
MTYPAVIEHRESSWTRNLRRNRLRFALGIAALEGILVIAGALPWWAVVLLAAAAIAVYISQGRTHPRADVRQLSWIAAVSQLVVVLVPIAVVVATALAIGVVVLLAAVALVVLLRERL